MSSLLIIQSGIQLLQLLPAHISEELALLQVLGEGKGPDRSFQLALSAHKDSNISAQGCEEVMKVPCGGQVNLNMLCIP